MGRNATINIDNNTGYPLSYVSADVEHGIYNEKPPPTIGKSGTFKVGNHDGAKVGPKGSITYKLSLTSETTIDLIFYCTFQI